MGHSRTLTSWRGVAQRLVADGFRVITLDNRDCGRTQRFDSAVPDPFPHTQPGAEPGVFAYTLDDMADDVVGVLDHYGVEKAHVVGASMGGMIAQILAVRHSSRCRSCVAIMTAARLSEGFGATAASDSFVFLQQKLGPAVHAEMMASPATCPTVEDFHAMRAAYWSALECDAAYPEMTEEAWARAQQIDSIDYARGGVDWGRRGADRQSLAVMEWERSRGAAHVDALRTLDVPLLVLHGRHDPLINIEHGRALAALVEGSLFVEFDAGHNLGNHESVTGSLVDAMVEHFRAQ